MIIEHTDRGCVVRAPAKLNLFLEVHGRRADGYHELETVMVAIGLYDVLTIREGRRDGRIELDCGDAALPQDESNLVLRAAQLLSRSAGSRRGTVIELSKQIPVAAGLGGGSSDAAATLAGLNSFWGLKLAPAELAQLGLQVGSDVPFFFFGPAGVCRGRGEQVTPLAVPRPLHFVVVCPRQGLSTGRVFDRLSPPEPDRQRDSDAMCRSLGAGAARPVADALFNRLETPAYDLCPSLATLRGRLSAAPALGSLMTGSGSAHFALCDGPGDAERVAHTMRDCGWDRVVVTHGPVACAVAGKGDGCGDHRGTRQADAGQGRTPPSVL